MNVPKYSKLYSNFHGVLGEPQNEDYLIVLNYVDMEFQPWSVLHMYEYETICMDNQKPFTQALKVFFNTNDPVTVMSHHNSWTALMGKSKTIMPMTSTSATFQMYATPYFVRDPAIVTEYMRGMSSQASDIVFSYKNCVLFLDKEDLPFPGGQYFASCRPCTNDVYRICILSKEPPKNVLSVAEEFRNKENLGVETYMFLTKDTISKPKMIPFQNVNRPFLPEDRAVSTGSIQKRLSAIQSHFLLQDILNSFYRNYLAAHNGQENTEVLNQLGLFVEWPFRLTYEGTRANPQEPKKFVALSVNGQTPNRVLYVRYPYDMYTEFNEVPATLWTPIYYVNTFLRLPPESEKVIVDSVVMGYVYKSSFFCFSHPILEGRPSKESKRNMEYIFQPAELTDEFKVLETYRFDEKHALNRVIQSKVPYGTWCLTRAENAVGNPAENRLPKLVVEWLGLFRHRKENFVDTKSIQMALTLARHKICFQTKINPHAKKEGSVYMLSENDIELKMGQTEMNFINNIRVAGETAKELENESSCVIC